MVRVIIDPPVTFPPNTPPASITHELERRFNTDMTDGTLTDLCSI